MRTTTMLPRRRTAALIVPVAAVALFATACTGNDSGDSWKAGPGAGSPSAHAPSAPSAPATTRPGATPSGRPVPGPSLQPRPPAPSGAPDEARLRAVLLNDQEIPADYVGGTVSSSDDSGDPPASDPNCAGFLNSPPEVAGVEREYTPAPGSADPADSGVVIALSSYRREVLDAQWASLEKAVRLCRSFTIEQGTGTLSYVVSDAQTGRYGPGSASLRVRMADASGAMQQADLVYARVGDVVVRVIAVSSSATVEPHLPAVFVTGQIEKVAAEIGR